MPSESSPGPNPFSTRFQQFLSIREWHFCAVLSAFSSLSIDGPFMIGQESRPVTEPRTAILSMLCSNFQVYWKETFWRLRKDLSLTRCLHEKKVVFKFEAFRGICLKFAYVSYNSKHRSARDGDLKLRIRRAYKHFLTEHIIHGHRTSKAPHPVRSAQLTGVPLS